MAICPVMLKKEKITRETHFPLNPQKACRRCAGQEHHPVNFQHEAVAYALRGDPIPANSGRDIKADVVCRGICLDCRSKA